MKILYVEDNSKDGELVQRSLRKHSPPFALEVVATQSEAIARLSGPDAPSFDLVLTDLQLPDGDGISLLTYIRTRGLSSAVVIAGEGDEKTAVTVFNAGADDYVSTRLDDLQSLPDTLENALRRRQAQSYRLVRNLKVLYAESYDTDIELTRQHFYRHAPYIFFDVVRTGAEALRRVTDVDATYDVILLDYQLPDLDALEILRLMRRNDACDTPVVLITREHGEEPVRRAFRLGASGYLVKNSGYLHQLPAELENVFYRVEMIRDQAALKQSEERLRRAQGAARVGTWDWNLDTGESYWSDGIYELLGLPHGDGRATVEDFVSFIHPEDREPMLTKVTSIIKSGENFSGEFRIVRGDGSIAWLSSTGRVIRSASGRAERMIGVNIDITERKRTELALRESEERFRNAFDHATIGMALVAKDGRLLQVNLSVCKLLGYSEQELLATNFQSLTHPQDLDANLELSRQLLAGEIDAFHMEKRYIHKSGRTVWGLLSVSLLRDGDGQPLYFIAQLQDITERKRTELRFNIQYAISRILSEAASVADAAPRLLQAICEPLGCEFGELWVPDREAGHLTLLECWSQPSTELVQFASASLQFNFTPDAGIPGHIWKSCRPAWSTHLVSDSRFLRRSLAQTAGLNSGFGFPALVGDHTVAVMMFFSREIRERDDYLLRMALSIGDQIGQFAVRKQAEEALRLSEDKFSKAFRSSPDAFGISRQADGMIFEVNQRWMEILGYTHEEAVGRTVSELQIYVDFGDRGKLLSLVRKQGFTRDVEMDLRRKSGEVRNVLVSAEPIMIRDEPCLLLIVRDITHQKRMEHALRRSDEALRDSKTRIEDLAGRLIVAQEEERKHLARELHDDLNQQVAALAIGISRLKQALPDADAGIQDQIVRLRKETEWLSERIRQVSHELHSSVLQHVGLRAALTSYCAEFSDQEGIAVTLDIQEGVGAVPPEAALCLYRVAQESLRNIAKHSGVQSAVVELSGTNEGVELRIIDQGVGFDPGQAREGRGLGLLSMEERVKLLHGSLVLTARPGAGTELRARIPLRIDHEQNKSFVG